MITTIIISTVLTAYIIQIAMYIASALFAFGLLEITFFKKRRRKVREDLQTLLIAHALIINKDKLLKGTVMYNKDEAYTVVTLSEHLMADAARMYGINLNFVDENTKVNEMK